MASAIKRSGTWYAKRKDAFGKPQRKATTAKTKKECEALAHELEVEAERGRFGLQPLPAKSNVTLGELRNWWLNEPVRRRAPIANVLASRSTSSNSRSDRGGCPK